MNHHGMNGSPAWMRVGIDMPVGKGTKVSWNAFKNDSFQSQVNFNQKINDNTSVEFQNKYVMGKPVQVGMLFNYNV
jgi:hypothetical protein